MAGHITWVIKSSKLCNLRCTYCYEFDSLSDSTRIPEGEFISIFKKVRDISAEFGAIPKFCWHGGEPLLLSPAYYEAAFRDQAEVFGAGTVSNVIQTNLIALGPKQLKLLSMFDHISISLDVFGGHRLTKNGRDSQGIVLENLAHLVNAGHRPGAIVVLTSENALRIADIFHFYNRAGISFRVLPFYRSANNDQRSHHSIDYQTLIQAYSTLMDLWFSEGQGIEIKPIDDFVRAAIIHMSRNTEVRMQYDKTHREYVFVLDTNLDVYSVADTYDISYRHGNLKIDSVAELLGSRGRRKAIFDAEYRMRKACDSCQYFGACSGWPVAEATIVEREMMRLSDAKCVAALPLIDRAVSWIASDNDLALALSRPPLGEFDYA